MSQVLGIREVIASERLRSDHIETLELLQKSKNENLELKLRIHELEDELLIVQSKRDGDNKNLEANVYIMAKMQEQEEQIQSLKSNLATIMAEHKTSKIVAAKKIRETESAATSYKVSLQETLQNITQYETWNLMLIEDLNSQLLRFVHFQMKKNLVSIEIRHSLTQTENEVVDSDIIDKSNTQIQILESQLEDMRKEKCKIELENINLNKEISSLQQTLESKENEIESLIQSIQSSCNTNNNIGNNPIHINPTEEILLNRNQKEELVVVKELMYSDDNNIIVPKIPLQLQEEEESSSFGFAEFVRLRKENKILRLQVAQISGGSSEVVHSLQEGRANTHMKYKSQVNPNHHDYYYQQQHELPNATRKQLIVRRKK